MPLLPFPRRSRPARTHLVPALALLAAMLPALAAAETVRVANFPNLTVLPLFHAQAQGYFKAEGLDVEVMALQTGPAAVSAVASGQADIAWAAASPPIQARASGVPIKIFLTAGQELQPDHATTFLVATARSGVTSVAGLKGKTVLINANGSACELMVRQKLKEAGLAWTDVKRVAVPFPQMPAALEMGGADAACTIELAQFAINRTPAIGARVLAKGILPATAAPVLSSGFFAGESWLAAHRDTAIAFARAYARAEADIAAQPGLAARLAIDHAGLAPEFADQVGLSWRRDQAVQPQAVQPTIDAMAEAGQIKAGFAAAEIVETLPLP